MKHLLCLLWRKKYSFCWLSAFDVEVSLNRPQTNFFPKYFSSRQNGTETEISVPAAEHVPKGVEKFRQK